MVPSTAVNSNWTSNMVPGGKYEGDRTSISPEARRSVVLDEFDV